MIGGNSKMRFIKLKEVMDCTGLGRSTIYKYIENDQFPKQISLGDRAVTWVEREVHDWMMDSLKRVNKVKREYYYLNEVIDNIGYKASRVNFSD